MVTRLVHVTCPKTIVTHAQVPAPSPSTIIYPAVTVTGPTAVVAVGDLLAPAPGERQQFRAQSPAEEPHRADALALVPATFQPATPSPAPTPTDASQTFNTAAGSSTSPADSHQLIITAIVASIALAALLAAIILCKNCASRRKALKSVRASASRGRGGSQPNLGESTVLEQQQQQQQQQAGPLSLPNLPIRFRPLQLRPAIHPDNVSIQMSGRALLPTHTSPSATPKSARNTAPAQTSLTASSAALGDAQGTAVHSGARRGFGDHERLPVLPALQMEAEHGGLLLQPMPLTRRWTWQVCRVWITTLCQCACERVSLVNAPPVCHLHAQFSRTEMS